MFLLKPKKGHDNDVLTETQREKLLHVASIALQQANYYTRYASTLERPSDRHAYTAMANVCLDVSLVLERFSEDGGTVRDVTASLPERTIDYLLASDFFICIYGAIPVDRADVEPERITTIKAYKPDDSKLMALIARRSVGAPS